MIEPATHSTHIRQTKGRLIGWPEGPTSAQTRTLSWAAVSLMLYLSSIVDVPGRVDSGAISILGALTVLYGACAWILFGLAPVVIGSLVSAAWLFGLFLLWGYASFAWHPVTVAGFQNLAVIGTFLGALLVCARESRRSPWFQRRVEKAFGASMIAAALLYGLALVVGGFGSSVLMGARTFALFGLLGVAFFLGAWRYGSKRALLWAVVLTVLIGTSLSRMAFVIALGLFPLAQRPSRGVKEFARVCLWLGVVVLAGYLAITHVVPLRERFFTGDMSLDLGGVTLNASGRTVFWKATVDSYTESWLLGKGPGSAEALIKTTFVSIAHPHSDYLKILHDYGAIGMMLWVMAMGALIWRAGRAWIRSDRQRSSDAGLRLSALLVLAAIVLMMTLENALVYIYVMGPAGALVGTSLGAMGGHRSA